MPRNSLHVYPDVPGLLHAAAGFVRDRIRVVLSVSERCSIALSGGNTPKALYALLSADPLKKEIEWNRILFFYGDERFVPADHPDSNSRMAWEHLLGPAGVETNHIFPVDTTLSPVQAAVEYEKTIREKIGKEGSFDIILLGLGSDAHTASLFRHTDVLNEHSAWVKEVYVASLDAWRITFTVPLINAAKTVVFLAHGASKAAAVQRVLHGPQDPQSYPAQYIAPHKGEVHWFVDAAAAGEQ